MIGKRVRFVSRLDDAVTAVCYDVRADVPRYDIEIVREGVVIERFEGVIGKEALAALAKRRGWRKVGRHV